MSAAHSGFVVEVVAAPPASLVVASPEPGRGRRARLCEPTHPALVLGSAQHDDLIDRDAVVLAGYEVVRRRSGGGALLVGPGRQVWLDVFVPADDPLARDDIGASAWWLGELWAGCLLEIGACTEAVSVHRGGSSGALGRVVCFAGLGPGEVLVGAAKLVGISQRRNRHGSWLHSMALLGGDPAEVVGYLDAAHLDPARRQELLATLRRDVAVLQPSLAGPLVSCLGARLASFEG